MTAISSRLTSTDDIRPGDSFWVYRRKSGWNLLTCDRVQNGRIYCVEQVFPQYYYPNECYSALPVCANTEPWFWPMLWFMSFIVLGALIMAAKP